MKKYPVLSALSTICLVQFAIAQVDKGNKMLGGSFGLNTKHYDEYDGNDLIFSIAPRFGYGLRGNWIIGADLTYRYSRSKAGDLTYKEANTFGPSLFARKFYPFNEHFGFFGEAGVFYGFGDSTYQPTMGGPEKWKTREFSASVHPGIYFKPTKHFSMEASIGNIGYTKTTSTRPDGYKPVTSEFNISFINNLNLGFFFLF